jgi:hypothetical protein
VFLGASKPSFVIAGTAAVTTTSTTLPLPTGYREDDLLVMVVECGGSAGYSPPTGSWSQIPSTPISTGSLTTDTQFNIFYKAAIASEPSVTITAVSDITIAQMYLFRGAKYSAPIENDAVSILTSASTSVSTPSITTGGLNRLVVTGVSNTKDSTIAPTSAWTNTDLTGFAEIGVRNTNTLAGGGFSVASGFKASGGAVSSSTATLDTASIQSRFTFAIKPYSEFTIAVNAVSEALIVTASAASIQLGNDHIINGIPAALIISANGAGVHIGTQVNASIRALALSGNVASIQIGSDHIINANIANLSLAGNNANVIQNTIIGAMPPLISIAGVSCGVLFTQVLSTNVRALSLSGNTATIKLDIALNAVVASLQLSGYNAVILDGFALAVKSSKSIDMTMHYSSIAMINYASEIKMDASGENVGLTQ